MCQNIIKAKYFSHIRRHSHSHRRTIYDIRSHFFAKQRYTQHCRMKHWLIEPKTQKNSVLNPDQTKLKYNPPETFKNHNVHHNLSVIQSPLIAACLSTLSSFTSTKISKTFPVPSTRQAKGKTLITKKIRRCSLSSKAKRITPHKMKETGSFSRFPFGSVTWMLWRLTCSV